MSEGTGTGGTGEVGSLGTGPMSYTREEISCMLAPLVSAEPDPEEIGAFIVLTCDRNGKLSGWRTDCAAPEYVVGLLSQGLAAAARIIQIERAHHGGEMHPHQQQPRQQGDADTIPDE